MRTFKAVVSDLDLREAVLAELEWDPKVDDSRIRVSAKNGAVVLGGYVTSYPEKRAALEAAERIHGVRTVADDMQVVLPRSVKRRDAAIAEEIARERQWNTAIPESVTVEVRKGEITLRGHVEREEQRDEAERAVDHLDGVRSVVNLVEVELEGDPERSNRDERDAERS
ncbi:MAG TPA: BON domain-containing protein [Gaiellaceae bacterium]|nr:BON domain-containing protein [Gaiellaceae bacterium]